MRCLGKTLVVLCVTVVGVSLAMGQQGFPIPFGGGGQADPGALVRNPGVQKELKLSEEQIAKLPEAVLKALGEVLNPDQLKRLKQIELQQRGTQAFKEPKVQTALKFTNEQKEKVNTILEDSAKELKAVMEEARGGNFQGLREKMTNLRKETDERLDSVLTAQQKTAWKDMIGAEFKMDRGGFGGFGGGKRGFKKKDAE
jgi:Spy/CpxP family protein refolding chaperone